MAKAMAKARTVFVFACFFALVALALLSALEAKNTPRVIHGDNNTNIPSRTAGHHGGELATASVGGGGDASYLQSGGDGSPDDYLIVCDDTANGTPARGGVYDNYAGWKFIDDPHGGGCSHNEYWFNGEKHDINGGHVSWH